MKCTEYLGMTPREALEVFSDKYYGEGDITENGVIAKVILDYFEEVVSKEDYDELNDENDELRSKLSDIEDLCNGY